MSTRKSGYSLLYIFMSFVVGCILAGIVAVTLSKPSPKTPAVPGQTADAKPPPRARKTSLLLTLRS